jgi:hypothetical protein
LASNLLAKPAWQAELATYQLNNTEHKLYFLTWYIINSVGAELALLGL